MGGSWRIIRLKLQKLPAVYTDILVGFKLVVLLMCFLVDRLSMMG